MQDMIRNCEFRYQCPKDWDSLIPTTVASQRHCPECQKTVYFCRTASELMREIKANHCVAVEIRKSRRSDPMILMGDPIP